jgi:hypothetical protein
VITDLRSQSIDEQAFDSIDTSGTQVLTDVQKLCYSYLAAGMVVEGRLSQFKNMFDEFSNMMENNNLALANLKMLYLRMLVKNRNNQKASQIALELQEEFEEADCRQGEVIAYYFLYQLFKTNNIQEQQVIAHINSRLLRVKHGN